MKLINIKGIGEVEQEYHFKNIKLKDIKVPKGMRILKIEELLKLWNEHREKFDWGGDKFDEVIENPFKEFRTKYPFYNLWFRCVGDGSVLYGGRDLGYGSGARGVRFVKSKK